MEQKRVPKGQPGGGRFLPMPSDPPSTETLPPHLLSFSTTEDTNPGIDVLELETWRAIVKDNFPFAATYDVWAAQQDLRHEGFTEHEVLDASLIDRRQAQQAVIDSVPGIVSLEPAGSQRDQYELDEHGRPAVIYYASYGSNLFEERFNVYITGGQLPGNARDYPGCRDATPPTDTIPVALNGSIFYAGESTAWTGGVAFLDADSPCGHSLGRAYRITSAQFDDVVAQENNTPTPGALQDLASLVETGRHEGLGAYGTLVHVGDYNGAPVVTFTSPFSASDARKGGLVVNHEGRLLPEDHPDAQPVEGKRAPWRVFLNHPSDRYQRMISAGLEESHGLSNDQARTYFAGSSGFSEQS